MFRKAEKGYYASERERKKALRILDLDPKVPYTADQIRQAFKQRLAATHPDVGGDGGDVAALKGARDILLEVFK